MNINQMVDVLATAITIEQTAQQDFRTLYGQEKDTFSVKTEGDITFFIHGEKVVRLSKVRNHKSELVGLNIWLTRGRLKGEEHSNVNFESLQHMKEYHWSQHFYKRELGLHEMPKEKMEKIVWQYLSELAS